MKSFNISQWALDHRSFVWFLMAIALVAGIMSYRALGREEDPSFTIKTMVVQAQWPGARISDTITQLTDRIEKEMPKAKPEVQWTMNNTLAAIAIHHPKLRKRALAIGETIGLYRDWPVSKGCIIPYVPVWVEAIVNRQD